MRKGDIQMRINYSEENRKRTDFELKQGDYVVDETDDIVYVLSIVSDTHREGTLYNLFSLVDGARWDEAKPLDEIKSDIISEHSKVYRNGRMDLVLSEKIF